MRSEIGMDKDRGYAVHGAHWSQKCGRDIGASEIASLRVGYHERRLTARAPSIQEKGRERVREAVVVLKRFVAKALDLGC